MRIITQLFFSVIIVAGLVTAWPWLSGKGDAQARKRPAGSQDNGVLVLVEPVALADDKVVVRALGTVDAVRSATIHPAVAGEVIKLNFTAEQTVARGEMLVQLDDEHQHLAVRLAQVVLAEAKREVVRLEELARSGSVSKAGLQTAQADLKSAGLRLEQAEANLADRTIRAPFAGVVGLSEIEIGDRVSTDTQITTLDDRRSLLIDFTLPEDYAERVKVGDPLRVQPWTTRGQMLDGVVAQTASRIDPSSRSLRVRAELPSPDGKVRPGTSVEVEFQFTGRSYPKIREVAVLWSRDGAYLWRASNGKAQKVFVQLVRRNEGHVLVDGPLDKDDLIVVEGVQGLRSGQLLDAKPFVSDKGQVASETTTADPV